MVTKTLKINLIFIFLLMLLLPLSAQNYSPSLPRSTELIDQSTETRDYSVTNTYEYRSRLSKEEIVGFYKNLFISRGMKEMSKGRSARAIAFRGPLKIEIISFLPSPEEKGTLFRRVTQAITRLPIIPGTGFTAPKKLDFMPVYPGATQFIYNPYNVPMVGIGYLTKSSTQKVSDFYLNNMSSFGWTLEDKESHQGRYKFYEWLKIVDPFTDAAPRLKIMEYGKIIPPLKVRGTTLLFTQGEKSCTITIYKFDDIVAKAKGRVWDATPIEKYGDTLICVYHFSQKR
ncbi:MAG: hypothetical protein JSW40_02595 [Candidatus Omnitrophota bacterium]|nr:MAG: hypothetical protein JSW40_02595 [Candidatus Omnitrophota bacterium]